MTKVDIISGFLGAGKTTFIKELIEKVFAGEKLVLIENEFGEIGIDGGFLQDAGIEITEMNSGCICCTLVGDFSVALKKVLDEYHPDHVIIEPSGVGKLSDVAAAIENVKEDADIEIEGRITVVDGKKAKMYLDNFGEFFENQVEHASTIVISRTQNMTDEKIEACVHLLREKNDKATIISTPWDQLSGDAIRHALEHGAEIEGLFEHHHDHDEECTCGHHHEHHHDHDEECGCGHHHGHHHDHDEECSCGCGHHHHHHADEVFTSWGKETAHKYTEEELDYLLKALSETDAYGTILRSKGIIQMTDGNWKQFEDVYKRQLFIHILVWMIICIYIPDSKVFIFNFNWIFLNIKWQVFSCRLNDLAVHSFKYQLCHWILYLKCTSESGTIHTFRATVDNDKL